MADNAPRRRTPNFTQPDGVALKEHLEKLIAAQADYFSARLASMEKADELASRRLDERLATMNEFREAMGDLSGRMVTREELALQMDRARADIADLKRSRDQAAGAASQTSVIIAMLFGMAGLVVGIINLLAH